ncbi:MULTISPECIES: hypothetical protein [unclassified Gordonia (in: high G+C Gram-positive bacteria)]
MNDITLRECVWCSSTDDLAYFRNEPRCARCRTSEQTIAEAREFVDFYGLRPLGGSLESDDEEERAHRVAAREARAELTRTRTEPSRRGKSRSGQRGVVATGSAGRTQPAGRTSASPARTAASATVRSSNVSGPDRAELEHRAEKLLAQLAEIEERLTVAQNDPGLSGKAKVSDLSAKRESVLRTLAALAKATRSLEPA